MDIVSSALSLSANLPAGWAYHGCYTDYGRRKLSGPSFVEFGNMTQESCVTFCNDNDYAYAGIEYGGECYCGLLIGAGSEVKDDIECNFKCPGAAGEVCGSNNRLSIFYAQLLDDTRTNPGPNLTSRIGCLTDSVYNRVLPVWQASEDSMTVAKCASSCKIAGYSIAGLEFGRECFCGDALDVSATVTDEGCDMRCAGNSSEFCGGPERLDVYALNVTTEANSTTNTSPATPTCTSTPLSNPFLLNGGFEEGLTDWTAVAYNSSASAFDVGLTEDALEGCAALSVIPKLESRSLAQHFQISTMLINLEPSYNYTIDLSVGNPPGADGRNAIYDPKYTVRLKDHLLGYGAICGFAYAPCPLTGLNNSTYTTLNMPFRADSTNATLTVYLSWYNGNFDVPLYLDSVFVRATDNLVSNSSDPVQSDSQVTTSSPLNPRLVVSSTASDISSATSVPVEKTDVPDALGLTCPTPESCSGGPPPLEITSRTLRNSGFEDGVEGWDFVAEPGKFEITRTKQSVEGDFAASIKPQSQNMDSERSITLLTSMTNLNSSHEWYTVSISVGHADPAPLDGSAPWLRMTYRNDVTSDVQRPTVLCGANGPPAHGRNRPCELSGKEGALYGDYGMDTRSFLGTDGVFTNSTEMDIELQIVWPVGTPSIPVFVDQMKVWEIESGVISR
ncbi:hypothetical protein OPT61_g5108 [Boeremia exigua]|uniref:Uncharacterized protein n=1 Tax=Boeremia exigua TaxID=749465 RepID=A0ACC2IBN3_9PLEO|nr:hypothetical protein OPT61_g5108 [Boeremia exigua]